MPDTVTALATRDDFMDIQGFAVLVRDMKVEAVDRLLIRATRAIESRCDRRLAPFTITESARAEGIDPSAVEFGGWPLDMVAALGRSEAMAYGTTNLVRDVWLRQYAPVWPDMWAYSNVGVVLARAYGDTENVLASSLEGPEPDTGHLRLRLGTFMPVGTTIRITYSGGYQTVPYDLATACCYQAAKFAIRFAEPQPRKDLSTADLDDVLMDCLAPFIRS